MRTRLKYCLLAGIFAASLATDSWGASVLSYHNDLSSDGVNSSETILTPTNVAVSTFAKIHSTTLDGQAYGQPLYVPGVAVTSGPQAGKHNLVIVGTQNDSLYGIDADSGAIVWQDSFLVSGLSGATSITTVPSADTDTTDTYPQIGICCTPVIDGSTKMLFVTAKTKQIINGQTTTPNYVYTLYKIDITNGNATANANIVNSTIIADTAYDGTYYYYRTNADPSAPQDPFVVGAGEGSDDTNTFNDVTRVYFNALRQYNRPGLILLNGNVYIACGSHGDNNPYHGWLLSYSESALALTGVLNITPNGGLGGIWNSGGCPVVDANGSIYLMSGNGTFDGNNTSGVTGLNGQNLPAQGDYGDSIIRVVTDSTTTPASQNINGWGLKVADYFAPFNNQSLSSNDSDLGSGSMMLLPSSAGNSSHQNLIVGAGKQGNVYLADIASLGHYGTTDNVVKAEQVIDSCYSTPAFFNGTLYYSAAGDDVKAFPISNATLPGTPSFKSTDTFTWPGATPSVSADGTSNAILWLINYNGGSSSMLRAYNPASLGTEFWSSTLASGSRDALGAATKFSVPTVADGHVFVGTQTALVTYGLSSVAPLFTSIAPPNGTVGTAYAFNYDATGAPYPTFSVTSGALPPGLTLSTSGTLSGTPSTGGLFTGTVTASNAVNPAATQNFNITIGNTFSNWVKQEGLTGNQALPTAIVSPDGITNLMKYALGLNPFAVYNPGSTSLPLVQVQKFSGTPYLTLTFTGTATDVTYQVQASSDLVTWKTIYTSTPGQAPGTVTVQDSQPTSSSAARYMTLEVSQ